MAVDINFADLSIKDTLDLAIAIEDEAKERYEEFAAQMKAHHTHEAVPFFEKMAGVEEAHGDQLREQRSRLVGNEPATVDTTMIYDVEAPEYDQARAFMSPKDALMVALRAETKAFRFYANALRHVSDTELYALMTELRDAEQEHQAFVRAELAKLPPEPDFDPKDYVDEPKAQ